MRKTKELRGRLLGGMLALMLAMGVFAAGFWGTSLTSYAAGQAKVTAPNGAKIRQDADTSSTMVGGAEKDKVLTVLGQKQGADGYTWYQVQVNDTTTGYVRADLVEVSGDIPAEGAGESGGGEEAPPVDVIQVNPQGATVAVESGEIRDTASLAGQVLGTVPGGTAITVTGYVTDAEGVTWFQVNYISGETQVNGFLPQESCTLSGDLTPPGQEPEPTPTPEADPEPPRFEVVEKNGEWLLVDNVENPGNGFRIQELMDGYSTNAQLYRDSEANVKKQKIIIIVLVFLLVAAVAGIACLVFKIRDIMDSAYFNEVENETLRRKSASGDTGKQKSAMHTVGPKEQQPRGGSPRPVGAARPATAQRTSAPAGRAAEQRPGGAQGQRPAGRTGARPAGSVQGQGTHPAARPAAGAPQGTRPAGAVQGSRPAARPAGSAQGGRPAGRPSSVQGQRPVGAQGARRPEGTQARAPQGARPGQSAQKAQPKNFLSDEDEFEFEFLNYDEDEE